MDPARGSAYDTLPFINLFLKNGTKMHVDFIPLILLVRLTTWEVDSGMASGMDDLPLSS